MIFGIFAGSGGVTGPGAVVQSYYLLIIDDCINILSIGDSGTMITKTIKEYGKTSKRQRIDIAKGDGFTDGQEVVLIPIEKYAEIKQDILDLQNELMTARNESEMMAEVNAKLTEQIEELRNRKINLDKIVQNAVTPIDEHYQKEIEKKDNKIDSLETELKSLYFKANQYNLDMNGLNAIEMLIFRKHKKIIRNFNETITLVGVDPNVIAADVTALPGEDTDQEQ